MSKMRSWNLFVRVRDDNYSSVSSTVWQICAAQLQRCHNLRYWEMWTFACLHPIQDAEEVAKSLRT